MGVALLPGDVDEKGYDDVDEDDGDDGGVDGGRLRLHAVNVLEDVMLGDEEAEDGRREQEEGEQEESSESLGQGAVAIVVSDGQAARAIGRHGWTAGRHGKEEFFFWNLICTEKAFSLSTRPS